MMHTPLQHLASTFRLPLLILATLGFVGCSGGDEQMPTAPTSGVVLYQNNPVEGGSIVFAPIASGKDTTKSGKAATGEVGTDGTFILKTYGDEEGAIIGRHKVSYSPPSPKAQETPEGAHAGKVPKSPYEGLVPKELEVEVQSGNNSFEIQLVKSGGN